MNCSDLTISAIQNQAVHTGGCSTGQVYNYFKILSSYSTAYIAPSLDQLFGPWGSNIDLDPEDSATFEGGLNYNFSKSKSSFDFSLVYFNLAHLTLL